jgi:hypothetical protein
MHVLVLIKKSMDKRFKSFVMFDIMVYAGSAVVNAYTLVVTTARIVHFSQSKLYIRNQLWI